jgi:hypothetical protein
MSLDADANINTSTTQGNGDKPTIDESTNQGEDELRSEKSTAMDIDKQVSTKPPALSHTLTIITKYTFFFVFWIHRQYVFQEGQRAFQTVLQDFL